MAITRSSGLTFAGTWIGAAKAGLGPRAAIPSFLRQKNKKINAESTEIKTFLSRMIQADPVSETVPPLCGAPHKDCRCQGKMSV